MTAQTEERTTTVRPDKAAAVAEIAEHFRGSSAAVLTEYRGLTMAQLTELRRALGRETTYAVVKNTLTTIAAREAGVSGLDDLLAGPTAIAFVGGDPVEAAKGLRDFARGNPLLVIKGGVLDGKTLTADEIRRLADLESREVLLAKLAGAMSGSLAKAVGLFAAPLSQVARLAAALQEQRAAAGETLPAPAADGETPAGPAAESTATTSTDDTPAADSTPADSTSADSTPADSTSADSTPADSTPAETAAPTEG